jgi:Ni/Co efflux regulator RcnB
MKITSIVAALTAMSLGVAGTAFAQGNPANSETGPARHDTRPETNAMGGGQPERAQPSRPSQRAEPSRGQPERHAARDDRGHQARYDGRGAGPSHNFYRGGRLPSQYRDHRYVVNDWRGHHLSAPPRGYQWVQTGDDFVLAAIATGVIASVLLNSH